jgi:hypothetical protein
MFFIWASTVSLAVLPGLVGLVFPRWWWPFVWPIFGVALIALFMYVNLEVLPDPNAYTSDGTSWFAVVLFYSIAGGVGIGTGAAAVVVRKFG